MARESYEEEKRNRRISLVVTQSLYERIYAMAAIRQMPVNDFLFELLKKSAEKNKDVIDEFIKAQKAAAQKIVDSGIPF